MVLLKKLITVFHVHTTNEHGTCSIIAELVVSWSFLVYTYISPSIYINVEAEFMAVESSKIDSICVYIRDTNYTYIIKVPNLYHY